MKSKATKYKQRIINVWNEVAPFYHNRWAKNEIGPFSVTNDLIKSARIKSGYTVLDLACGTGLVTKKILTKVGKGQVYGVDSSKSALDIARKWVGKKQNIHFIQKRDFCCKESITNILSQLCRFIISNNNTY